jgi:hypothetical protein
MASAASRRDALTRLAETPIIGAASGGERSALRIFPPVPTSCRMAMPALSTSQSRGVCC